MDALQIHLWVNHVPIIGTIIGVIIAFGGMLLKSDVIRKTGLVIYVATGLFVFPANFTGEDAEDIVEDTVAMVSHDQIHAHEEQAETAMTLTALGMALALVSLFNWPKNASVQRLVTTAYLIVGVAGTIVIGLAGHEGGKIMRPHLGAQNAVQGQHNTDRDTDDDD